MTFFQTISDATVFGGRRYRNSKPRPLRSVKFWAGIWNCHQVGMRTSDSDWCYQWMLCTPSWPCVYPESNSQQLCQIHFGTYLKQRISYPHRITPLMTLKLLTRPNVSLSMGCDAWAWCLGETPPPSWHDNSSEIFDQWRATEGWNVNQSQRSEQSCDSPLIPWSWSVNRSYCML